MRKVCYSFFCDKNKLLLYDRDTYVSNRCRTMLWTMCTFERLRFVNELLNSRAEASDDEIADSDLFQWILVQG